MKERLRDGCGLHLNFDLKASLAEGGGLRVYHIFDRVTGGI